MNGRVAKSRQLYHARMGIRYPDTPSNRAPMATALNDAAQAADGLRPRRGQGEAGHQIRGGALNAANKRQRHQAAKNRAEVAERPQKGGRALDPLRPKTGSDQCAARDKKEPAQTIRSGGNSRKQQHHEAGKPGPKAVVYQPK